MLLTRNNTMEKGDLVKAKTSSSPQVQPGWPLQSKQAYLSLSFFGYQFPHAGAVDLDAGSASPPGYGRRSTRQTPSWPPQSSRYTLSKGWSEEGHYHRILDSNHPRNPTMVAHHQHRATTTTRSSRIPASGQTRHHPRYHMSAGSQPSIVFTSSKCVGWPEKGGVAMGRA